MKDVLKRFFDFHPARQNWTASVIAGLGLGGIALMLMHCPLVVSMTGLVISGLLLLFVFLG